MSLQDQTQQQSIYYQSLLPQEQRNHIIINCFNWYLQTN